MSTLNSEGPLGEMVMLFCVRFDGNAPNATWVVSENHGNALGAFREPLPSNEANPSNCKRFRQYVFTTNSGYRTRYPLVAGTTVCCAGRENSRSWQASITEDLGVRLDMPLFAWQLIYPKMT